MDINWIWDSAIAYLAQHLPGLIPYISPFWSDLLLWCLPIAFVAGLIGWGFPALRAPAASVILMVCAFLWGERKGEYQQYHHDQGDDK